MRTLFFTVCSLRQYPQALVLGHSLQQHHPDCVFFIGLADQPERLPVVAPRPFPVVGTQPLTIVDFQKFIEKYTWLEVLHALRPHFARYFFDRYPSANNLVFLSPESWVLSPLTGLLECLTERPIALLPQRLHPSHDGHWPAERHFLNVGVYQGEAWAVRRSAETARFLDWWSVRLREKGWLRLCEGYGLDQLWLNLVPAFFEQVAIVGEPGLGVGVGNADERPLTHTHAGWQVGNSPLTLVNWSGFDLDRLRWEAHQTDRATSEAWRSLAATYRRAVPAIGMPGPAFGQPFTPPRTPRSRYRFIRPLQRLTAWIDQVSVPFLR